MPNPPHGGAVDVLTAVEPGAELRIHFTGQSLFLSGIAGMDAGMLEISVDGGEVTTLELYDEYCGRFHRPVFRPLVADLPHGPHQVTLKIGLRKNTGSLGRAARILQFGVA